MARKFLVSIDLGTNELQNAVIQNLPNASEPTGIAGRIYYNTTSNVLKYYNGTSWQTLATSGGTVTSVGITYDTAAGNVFGISNSPVTTTGDLQITLDTQAANKVFAGPTTGSDAAPTFRSLVEADIPSITSAKISDITEAVQDIAGNAITAGTGISVTYDDAGAGTITIANTDLGSSQNIFKTVAVSGQSSIVADSNTDTLTLAGSTGLTITTDASTDTVTFTNSGVTSVNSVTGAVSASDLLTAIKTVDGTGSGLDADTLDGHDTSYFATASHTHVVGDITGLTEEIQDVSAGMITGATHSGISVSYDDTAGTLAFTNSGVTSLTGTTNEVEVSASSGSITVGLPDNVTVTGDLAVNGGDITSSATTFNLLNSTVTTLNIGGAATTLNLGNASGTVTIAGNLTVSGTTTTLNTETLLVEDNIVVLNSNVTGTPAANAGLEIERGDYTNASIYWDETANLWSVATPGDNTDPATATAISLVGHTHTSSNITDFTEAVQDVVGAFTSGSNSLSVTYSDSSNTLSLDTTLASTSYLSKSSGLAVDISTLESKLVTDSFTKKYAENNGSLTSSGGVCTWTVTHSLSTKDVTVQVFEVGSPYAQVEVDVEHTSTSVVTLKINSASTITADTYRVVVIG